MDTRSNVEARSSQRHLRGAARRGQPRCTLPLKALVIGTVLGLSSWSLVFAAWLLVR